MEAAHAPDSTRVDYSMTAGEPLPVAVRAQGCRIETADGRSYLDACGGAMRATRTARSSIGSLRNEKRYA